VIVQVARAREIADPAVLVGRGRVARAVLGDEQRAGAVLEVHAQQDLGEALREDLPADVGMLRARRDVDRGREVVVLRTAGDRAAVVVDPDEVAAGRDRREVARFDDRPAIRRQVAAAT